MNQFWKGLVIFNRVKITQLLGQIIKDGFIATAINSYYL
jgi:hypothetical protein